MYLFPRTGFVGSDDDYDRIVLWPLGCDAHFGQRVVNMVELRLGLYYIVVVDASTNDCIGYIY